MKRIKFKYLYNNKNKKLFNVFWEKIKKCVLFVKLH